MIHFHSVVWKSPASYPLFNYFPVLLESFLIATTIFVCALDALTQILLEGSITRTILCRSGSLMPMWEEDCSIVIARLGTASLEATSVAGLGNEVASVTVFDTLARGLGDDTDDPAAMELNRAGISSSGDLAHSLQRGFLNEVKNVKAVQMRDPNPLEARSLFSKELGRYVKGCLSVMKGAWILLRYGRGSQWPAAVPSSILPDEGLADETVSAEGDEDDYRRFLLGETISDDEDEYEHATRTPSSSHSSSDNEEDDLPVDLYHNLAGSESPASPVPVLLVHMADSSSFPLTRRRYQRLIEGAGQVSLVMDSPVNSGVSNLRRRRELTEASEDEGWDESRMNCVICMARPRQVICWPCR